MKIFLSCASREAASFNQKLHVWRCRVDFRSVKFLVREVKIMDKLWLLVGASDAPGWKNLEKDSKEEKIDLVSFDRDEWALIRAEKGSSEYEGLVPKAPKDGMYVSEHGYPIYIVGQKEVRSAEELIRAVGGRAQELLEELGDAVLALERAGLAF